MPAFPWILSPVSDLLTTLLFSLATRSNISEIDIQRLRARLAWVTLFEFPFSGLEADGCKSLIEGQECPLKANQTYTWSVKLPL